MSESDVLQGLLDRAKGGDDAAWEELVRRYKPYIHRAVRVRMYATRVQSVYDSADLCQSVFCRLLQRVRRGLDLSSHQQLVGLLARMATNRLIDRVRHEESERRDRRKTELLGLIGEFGVACRSRGPEDTAEERDTLARLLDILRPNEAGMLRALSEGLEWADIAKRFMPAGSSADAARHALHRAVKRVAPRLGLQAV